MTSKKPFLVTYDYGTGGLWAVIYARSKEDILGKFEGIKIVEHRPSTMTEDMYQGIASRRTVDIDDEPTGWLANFKNPN